MKSRLLFSLFVLLFLAAAQAQVPNLINYQGRVSVGTTNFNGTGQFRFALTNSSCPLSFSCFSPLLLVEAADDCLG